ncbi:MAG: ABC transporter substrate-binding protein [Lachnospiraceae bacterium]|nr:ABC transporter substrate-binding protein [Lachnospiraceae bacterium]
MRRRLGFWTILMFLSVFSMAGCTSVSSVEDIEEVADTQNVMEDDTDEGLIVIGFSQVGAESDWRKANTESMVKTFTREKGYDLILEDAQQKQQNQITAIRTFIQREVDYIVLAPVTEDGWDTVLTEAKDAGIPVIIVDRMVNVSDPELFKCWVGSDFELEGRKACEWLRNYCENKEIAPEEVNIVDIQGTAGASSQIGRTKGLKDAVRANGWNLLEEAAGEYTQAKGREATSRLLRKYDNINVVYCENDNEAFGAIEAIESAGRKVGNNITAGQIMVISFDGVSDQAIEYAKNGKISCIGECNPLHGPRVEKIIQNLQQGVTPDKYEYVDEDIFSGDSTVTSIEVNDSVYTIKILGK